MSAAAKNPSLRTLSATLRRPHRLRWLTCGVALAVAYFAIYSPCVERIAQAARALKEAKQRATVAGDTELLRAQVKLFEPRVATNPDPNECVHYVLNGIRARPLRLVQLDTDGTVNVGPYDAVVLRLEVTGEIAELDSLLAWLETNERLFRIDSVRLDPPHGQVPAPTLRLGLLALKVRQ